MLRHAYLRRQFQSLLARVRMLQGEKLTFDAESQALYDAVAPVHPESYFDEALQAIGEIDRAAAAAWLVRYALSTPKQAEQRTRFFDTYRSYVINYNLGKDLVQQFVESRGGVASQPEKRWAEFARLLASPRLPSGLR